MTTPHHLPDGPDTGSPARGILIGLALALPFWLAVAALVWRLW